VLDDGWGLSGPLYSDADARASGPSQDAEAGLRKRAEGSSKEPASGSGARASAAGERGLWAEPSTEEGMRGETPGGHRSSPPPDEWGGHRSSPPPDEWGFDLIGPDGRAWGSDVPAVSQEPPAAGADGLGSPGSERAPLGSLPRGSVRDGSPEAGRPSSTEAGPSDAEAAASGAAPPPASALSLSEALRAGLGEAGALQQRLAGLRARGVSTLARLDRAEDALRAIGPEAGPTVAEAGPTVAGDTPRASSSSMPRGGPAWGSAGDSSACSSGRDARAVAGGPEDGPEASPPGLPALAAFEPLGDAADDGGWSAVPLPAPRGLAARTASPQAGGDGDGPAGAEELQEKLAEARRMLAHGEISDAVFREVQAVLSEKRAQRGALGNAGGDEEGGGEEEEEEEEEEEGDEGGDWGEEPGSSWGTWDADDEGWGDDGAPPPRLPAPPVHDRTGVARSARGRRAHRQARPHRLTPATARALQETWRRTTTGLTRRLRRRRVGRTSPAGFSPA